MTVLIHEQPKTTDDERFFGRLFRSARLTTGLVELTYSVTLTQVANGAVVVVGIPMFIYKSIDEWIAAKTAPQRWASVVGTCYSLACVATEKRFPQTCAGLPSDCMGFYRRADEVVRKRIRNAGYKLARLQKNTSTPWVAEFAQSKTGLQELQMLRFLLDFRKQSSPRKALNSMYTKLSDKHLRSGTQGLITYARKPLTWPEAKCT